MSTLTNQIDNAESRFAKSKPERDAVLKELSKLAEGEKASIQSAAASTLQFDYLTAVAGVRKSVLLALNPMQFFITDEHPGFTIGSVRIRDYSADGQQFDHYYNSGYIVSAAFDVSP